MPPRIEYEMTPSAKALRPVCSTSCTDGRRSMAFRPRPGAPRSRRRRAMSPSRKTSRGGRTGARADDDKVRIARGCRDRRHCPSPSRFATQNPMFDGRHPALNQDRRSFPGCKMRFPLVSASIAPKSLRPGSPLAISCASGKDDTERPKNRTASE
ncbi:MAG: hypothetical protein IOD08_17795 [Bradyrhizobium sp.]|nr:hypothetical protein [Bradyrhizobium sp.]